ncbi:MAG: serine hydrolase [Halanaerobium sp.]|nr:serine hydrolase [Halanaerobium sp.]
MLTKKVQELNQKLSGVAGIVIKDLWGNFSFDLNPDLVFPAASVIKLCILWDLFKRASNGELDLEQQITLRENHKVGGFGILKELHTGLQLTVEDLATLMIVLSDNVATNMLIDLLGFARINSSIKEIGLKDTVLQRKMMDTQAAEQGLDNYTSPRDIAILLENYIKSELIDSKNREKMLDILMRQQCNNKLPALMPAGTKLAHKTGDLPGVEHDVGILDLPDQKICIIVLTRDLKDNQDGIKFNNQIGELVYNHFGHSGTE